MKAPIAPWTKSRKIFFRFTFLYVILFILTLSFPHPYIPDLPAVLAKMFEPLIHWLGVNVFKIQEPFAYEILSDSTGLYIHLLVLLVLSVIGTIAWSIFDLPRHGYRLLSHWFRTFISYYLAYHLMAYAFNKLFKWQFYLPEPNTLFTTIGDSYRDILYWSTMGTSHAYNVFLGAIELVAAVLLLFRRTRIIGAIISFFIMVNVVAVNFSFDISVKVYSLFLTLLSLLIFSPELKRMFEFFYHGQTASPVAWSPEYRRSNTKLVHVIAKCFVLLWMSWSLLSTYVRSGNFNDDVAKRPPFHGAYEVTGFVRNGDTIPPLTSDTRRWRRAFVHRRGYIILQAMNDDMKDYMFTVDTVNRRWVLQDPVTSNISEFYYTEAGDRILLHMKDLRVELTRIDLTKLNVLKKEFNWRMDVP